MAKTALVLIADGTEEMEFVIAFDTLVRAGVACTSALVSPGISSEGNSLTVTCSRGIRILADTKLEDLKQASTFDALIIPGGAKGAETLSQSSKVQQLVREYSESDKVIGMICAGSLVALAARLPRQKITSHPSARSQLEDVFDYSEDSVVVSGKLVTSRGPGTAFPFALQLVSLLCGDQKRKEVAEPMAFPNNKY